MPEPDALAPKRAYYRSPNSPRLRCQACGNSDRFEQVMYHVVNVVSDDMTYIRPLWADVDFYRCYECGEHVEPNPSEVGE